MAANGTNGGRREEKGRNIQVVVRCRPFNTVERKTSHSVIDCESARKEVAVKTGGGGASDKSSRKTYTFDMVFGAAAKQIEVYRSVVCPILDEVIMGYNCTVFAYGQTGTGKTFTMEGERTPNEQFTWEEDPLAGIIPRTLHQIFEKLSENNTEFSVKVSLLEIYNEELFDLLSPTEDVNERLQLYDDPRNKRGVVVKGLEEVTVHNKDEVYQILERGSAKRRTASTLMNAYSSRSHSVFSVTIHMKEITLEGEELVKIGKLNLVDLAGSENIGRSGAVDKRAREAGNINQSLLTLGRVITALVEKRPHIPYRESKLTRILQDSLGGRTKTSIIATVSPSSSNLEETLSTLEYASRAKNIMNKPEVNQKLTKRTLIKEYTEEIERLKRDLAATRDKNGVYVSAENYETMQVQISSYEEQISEYVDKISIMEEELKKVSELFLDSRSQLERCTVVLEEKQQRLEETSRDLQETKEKLMEEEIISSELNSAQQNLYNTAGELLSTVDQSTTDLNGMHDKLDRKKQVDQTNQKIQQGFAERMDGSFSQLQNRIQNHKEQQRNQLGGFSQTIADLVQMNEARLAGSLSSLSSLVDSVVPVVVEGASRCRDKVQQQGALSQREKEHLLQLLEEHHEDLKEDLLSRTLVGVSAVQQQLTESLRASVETQRVLAAQVEALKESSGFLVSVVQDLAVLRQDAVQRLEGVEEQRDKLQEEIRRAQESHQERVNQTLHALQLLAGDAQDSFSRLGSASRDLQGPLKNLQQDLSGGVSSVEGRVSSQAELLSSSTLSLASSLRRNAQDSQETLEETATLCRTISSSISGLVERDLHWTSRVSAQVENQNQEHKTRVEEISAEALSLQQEVERRCSEQSLLAQQEASARSQEVSRALRSLQEQTGANQSLAEQQGAELTEKLEESRQLVQQFLQEHLQQDTPTGTTPQRRDFLYPRQLARCRDRRELLESLRMRRQEEEEEEEEREEEEDKLSPADPDSLEDEASNVSAVTEPSFIDENLVFNEAERVPFFKKKKKGGKKEVKNTNKGRVQENEATPTKSRLPLRCQN